MIILQIKSLKYVDRNSENIDKSKIEIDETVED